jgi:lipoate---protein ligase
MKYLDLTLPTPQENLACDEALLDACEEGCDGEVLRFWESSAPFVVLGYSNKTATEVNLDSARRAHVPVLRRCTGGGAVLQGAGCLNYSLILKIPESGPLSGISSTNVHIMNRHRDALANILGGDIVVQGHSDLARDVMKFSGNAQRRRGDCLLFHGTFLLGADIELMERLLPMPSRRPAYRQDRGHRDFLTNLDLAACHIKGALKTTWQATERFSDLPAEKIASLAATQYSSDDWNFKF